MEALTIAYPEKAEYVISMWASNDTLIQYDKDTHRMYVTDGTHRFYIGSSSDVGHFCRTLHRYIFDDKREGDDTRIVPVYDTVSQRGIWFCFDRSLEGGGKFYRQGRRQGLLDEIWLKPEDIRHMITEVEKWSFGCGDQLAPYHGWRRDEA